MTQLQTKEASDSMDDSVQPLSRQERESLRKTFEEDGYIVLKNVISRERLAELHRQLTHEFESAKSSGALFSGGGMMSGHLNCFPGEGARFIYDTLKANGVIDLVAELDPKATKMPNIGCNFNLPGSVHQHYHTDRPFSKAFMIVNIAVVDTTIENGAMQLVPKSHSRFYKYWQFAMQGVWKKSIRMPMQQGDIMIRTSNTWHRGMPNVTSVARPMIALTWEDGGSVKDDPFMVDDGKITFKPNWFKPTKLGRIRERVFVSVPVTYSAYRFITSLYTNKGY